jgi:PTS system nitrogen regulatory IIA component
MKLTELLSIDRIAIHRSSDGGFDKSAAIHQLSTMLARGASVAETDVERVLSEREALQSTGIGEGVAIPHGALSVLDSPCASLLVTPDGLEFDAIDGAPVNIVFAVIHPKRATGEHLKTLARVSRLLKHRSFRDNLVAAPDGKTAYDLIAAEEGERR